MARTPDSTTAAESYWEKHGIPRVSLDEFGWNLELNIKNKITRGVLLAISEAGMGKSQIVHEIARKYDLRVCDIRTAQFGLIGAGVPQRADEDGMFTIAVPNDFPRPGERAILLFDEINQGQPHAIAMFFKLLEDREMYGYKLPEDCIIVGLMNPATALYQVSKIETNPAINRRVKKMYVYTTFGEWAKHAETTEFHRSDKLEKPCHPMVRRFLNTARNMLYTEKDRDGHKQFACPATWQTVSRDLYLMEEIGEPLTSERVQGRIAATINNVNAQQLVEFIKNNEIRISPEEVTEKYRPKSKIREKIKQLINEPGGGIPDLCENLAHYLFERKPDVSIVAPCLVLFWMDLPNELAQGFYSLLGTAAQDGDRSANIKYMQTLTKELQKEPLWGQMNSRLHAAHDSYERQLTGSKTPDPMK